MIHNHGFVHSVLIGQLPPLIGGPDCAIGVVLQKLHTQLLVLLVPPRLELQQLAVVIHVRNRCSFFRRGDCHPAAFERGRTSTANVDLRTIVFELDDLGEGVGIGNFREKRGHSIECQILSESNKEMYRLALLHYLE